MAPKAEDPMDGRPVEGTSRPLTRSFDRSLSLELVFSGLGPRLLARREPKRPMLDGSVKGRISPYWKCQIIGWSLQGIISVTIPTLYGGIRWAVVGRGIVGTLLGVMLTDQLRRHMKRQAWLSLPLRRLIPRLAAASLTIAIAMVLGILPFVLMFIPPPLRTGPIAAIVAGHVAVIAVWATIYVGLHYLWEVRTAHSQ